MLEGVSKINLLLKILLGILFVSISSWNNTISTRQKVNKKAEKHRTEPMTGGTVSFHVFSKCDDVYWFLFTFGSYLF